MIESIKNFPTQFSYEPVIVNGPIPAYNLYIICGMGGSHLAADLLVKMMPDTDIVVHSDYGLPRGISTEAEKTVVIVSSYSGTTEETLDSFEVARKQGLAVVAVATGGSLLERAKKDGVPYVQIPDTGIQPRQAIGYSIRALLRVMGRGNLLTELATLAKKLDAASLENDGSILAHRMKGYVPVIYSSSKNLPIAYNWKIKFNETGKIPAFYNVLPELNHNEMTGFDVKESTRELSKKFFFLFLRDMEDFPRIQKRFDVLERLYQIRGLLVHVVQLSGTSAWEKIFSSLVLADWVAYYSAVAYGVEPEQVPMVEEFKKEIAQ